MSLQGTKTHDNLKEAFAGESQANRRYLWFAQKADIEGYPDAAMLFRSVAEGETVRFTMRNDSELWHPMHLHGHSFRVRTASGPGPVKDTVSVPAKGGTATFDFIARNPGAWMFHCHNHYHMDNGMARLVTYT